MARFRVGVDIGGTFTDIVFLDDDGTVHTKKVSSSVDDYARAIVESIRELFHETGVAGHDVSEVLHGTTVASNAILELRGARTGLITTKGFRDVLEIRRLRMPRLYDIAWQKPAPLVERRLRMEVAERITARGDVEIPLDPAEVERVLDRLLGHGIEALAVCLLNAYANPAHEQQIKAIVERRVPGMPFCISTDVLPEIREYERSSTTVINAYVMPVVQRYLRTLRAGLGEIAVRTPLLIIQSNGGLMTAEAASRMPMHIIESGPAAGVIGAQALARRTGMAKIITFDMGGTTAKASIVEDGEVNRATEYSVGGGCYDLGGTEPTITDANVILGYLNPTHLVGGALKLNASRSHEVFEARIARPLGLELAEAAYGAHLIAASNMIRAIKSVSSERGRDPREYALFAFGGNGPLFAAGMARQLDMTRIVVPPAPGLFSSFGLLYGEVEHHYVKTYRRATRTLGLGELNGIVAQMEAEALAQLASEGFTGASARLRRSADLCYQGQSFELTVPLGLGQLDRRATGELEEAFGREHERVYGHRAGPDEPVQLVSLRLVAQGIPDRPRVPDRVVVDRHQPAPAGESPRREVYFGPEHGWRRTPILRRADLADVVEGPAIVEEYDATCLIPPSAAGRLDAYGNIVIELR